jgi:hypothetical protein
MQIIKNEGIELLNNVLVLCNIKPAFFVYVCLLFDSDYAVKIEEKKNTLKLLKFVFLTFLK